MQGLMNIAHKMHQKQQRFAPFRRFLAGWTADAMASQVVAAAARTGNKSA